MHLELLVEDQSGKKALEILVPKILGGDHTFRVHPYKGIGRIPRGLGGKTCVSKRILLDQLPRLLRGYGKTYAGYPEGYRVAVVVVCDLDDRCLKEFRADMEGILASCDPRPETRFCFAIEEGEAWLLGDIAAVKAEFPNARDAVLRAYVNDTICGTWECLADAVFPGGAAALSEMGWQAIGAEKCAWSERIPPHMDLAINASPSFHYFVRQLRDLVD